ncbi:hypothetical protein L6452_01088 [Arctium lappa]|uniref:Uncharacterized protein n=1 Tax=Arctium lappa TaxID=4217 RepID=A0ACB9FG53_ARCLA|nr:hypothetical protein L6452_01088 [Arctium lappa]
MSSFRQRVHRRRLSRFHRRPVSLLLSNYLPNFFFQISSFHNDMNSSSSISNHGFRNSNETNTILGFNLSPMATSRNLGGSRSGNASKKVFSSGAGSRNNPSWNSGSELGVSGVVLDEMMKSKSGGDKSGGNVAFNFKMFESENTKSFDESMVVINLGLYKYESEVKHVVLVREVIHGRLQLES